MAEDKRDCTCANCAFCAMEDYGWFCHRYPPAMVGNAYPEAFFSEVVDGDWCGEWRGQDGKKPWHPGKSSHGSSTR